MRPSLRRLKSLIQSPVTTFLTGTILLVSGLTSIYDDFTSAEHTFRLGVHHGVALWAIVQVLGSLPDLIDGIERSVQLIEKRYEGDN